MIQVIKALVLLKYYLISVITKIPAVTGLHIIAAH